MQKTNVIYRESKPTAVKLLFLAVLSAVMLWGPWAGAQSTPVRIMPLGDSITSSIDGQASYRYWLWKRLQAAGFNVDFVGTLWGVGDGASGIYPDFDQDHEGHPGATTDDILNSISSWAAQDQPDVVLLLIG
ncbi:MAG TPA: hypothetical protein VNT26_10290, partial [Candidatus Sulfotelmatobacter sp.]|nr:hypothetical protein [Candidatus Sulfotelmatobacter sp.]